MKVLFLIVAGLLFVACTAKPEAGLPGSDAGMPGAPAAPAAPSGVPSAPGSMPGAPSAPGSMPGGGAPEAPGLGK